MNKLLIILLLFSVFADVYAAEANKEIEHLLGFVEDSGCTFERNGSTYDSREARSHIQRKYDYIKKRVKTAEDFIRYAATESSMSGRKYHATCEGRTITSEEWLTTELKRYRQQNP
ncbi:DUF5329 family protein [Thiolapillus sp.]